MQAQKATYREIREFWDLEEVLRHNELMDMQADADWMATRPKPGRR